MYWLVNSVKTRLQQSTNNQHISLWDGGRCAICSELAARESTTLGYRTKWHEFKSGNQHFCINEHQRCFRDKEFPSARHENIKGSQSQYYLQIKRVFSPEAMMSIVSPEVCVRTLVHWLCWRWGLVIQKMCLRTMETTLLKGHNFRQDLLWDAHDIDSLLHSQLPGSHRFSAPPSSWAGHYWQTWC